MARTDNAFTITSGPSELDFFVLGLAKSQPITFKTKEDPRKIIVIIRGIEHADNSGVNWRFKGYIDESCKLFNPREPHARIEGNFSYRDGRSGWLKILHTEYNDHDPH